MWGRAACTCGMRMHTADRSAAPDERVGLCTCPEHAAYTWTGHVYVRLCRMCVLSEACSMHMAYVHARSHARLRASRDRRCPLAPVCAWTDTGRHGAARRVTTERCSSGFVRLSRSLAAPIGRAGIEGAHSPAHAPRTRTVGPMGSAAYGLGVARSLLPAFAHVFCPLWARYTVPLMGDGYRAAESSVPGQRLHLALQVLQVHRASQLS